MSSPADEPLPDDVETLKALLLAHRAELRNQALQIEKLRHQVAKLRQERFGQSSERRALLDQLELQLFELEENQAQAETAAQLAKPQTQTVQSFERRKPARRPLPEHLPRERVVYPIPSACPCCGGALHKLGEDSQAKLGEDVTETLELVPRQWKVVQHVREKFSCRTCEKITQPPAPSHPIARGRRAAAIYTLIQTAMLNDVDPQAWLADVLARLQDHPARRVAELLPWNWKLQQQQQQRAAA